LESVTRKSRKQGENTVNENEGKEPSGIEKLVAIMQTMSQAMQTMSTTLEKLTEEQARMAQEQERMGKAIGEAGLILQDHTQNIRNIGAAVVRLWHEANLPIEEAPQPPPGPVN
jgi:K+/H+ antiporter YhaU regulatory subunit KhtT